MYVRMYACMHACMSKLGGGGSPEREIFLGCVSANKKGTEDDDGEISAQDFSAQDFGGFGGVCASLVETGRP